VAERISSLNFRERRTILNRVSTLQGKPDSYAWNIQRSFPKQPFPSYSGLWIRATTSDCKTVRTPIVQDIRLQHDYMIVLLSALQNALPHVGACKHKIKVEWWRHVHLPGHSGTRLTALPYFAACGYYFQTLSHHYHTLRP
jgi:hypothetical protein